MDEGKGKGCYKSIDEATDEVKLCGKELGGDADYADPVSSKLSESSTFRIP